MCQPGSVKRALWIISGSDICQGITHNHIGQLVAFPENAVAQSGEGIRQGHTSQTWLAGKREVSNCGNPFTNRNISYKIIQKKRLGSNAGNWSTVDGAWDEDYAGVIRVARDVERAVVVGC